MNYLCSSAPLWKTSSGIMTWGLPVWEIVTGATLLRVLSVFLLIVLDHDSFAGAPGWLSPALEEILNAAIGSTWGFRQCHSAHVVLAALLFWAATSEIIWGVWRKPPDPVCSEGVEDWEIPSGGKTLIDLESLEPVVFTVLKGAYLGFWPLEFIVFGKHSSNLLELSTSIDERWREEEEALTSLATPKGGVVS